MLPTILALFHFTFAVPQPSIYWIGQDAVKIKADGSGALLNRCVESGIEVMYRYEMQYCRRRSAWFDDCNDERTEIRTLQFDPVNETYRVVVDRHGDDKKPESFTYPTLSEAQQQLSEVSRVPIDFITRGETAERGSKDYIGIRIVSECKGSLTGSLLDISNILTFGLIKINRFDSGWIAFFL